MVVTSLPDVHNNFADADAEVAGTPIVFLPAPNDVFVKDPGVLVTDTIEQALAA